MKKIAIPEDMMRAVDKAISEVRGVGHDLTGGQVRDIAIESALCWISENAPVPTHEIVASFVAESPSLGLIDQNRRVARRWMETAFVFPEPKIPEGVRDLMWGVNNPSDKNDGRVCGDHNLNVIEAYRRGWVEGR